MKKWDIYDTSEKKHEKTFKRLPPALQEIIRDAQRTLQLLVTTRYKNAIPTSGYRCPQVNTSVGGVVDSLHLFGFARDFYCTEPIANDFEHFTVLRIKKNHYHVMYKRGK